MKPLSLRSERFSKEGSISAAAIRQNMGRSTLDPISLLIREAVQNSWDARVDREKGGIDFSLHLGPLGRKQSEVLKKTVFKTIPPGHPLKAILSHDTSMLCIRDVGTNGLNGPVFHVARRGQGDDGSRNFIRFVRDIGRGASTQLSGGTYGFGKSTFYVASKAATVLIFTRCKSEKKNEELEERLIACSLWNPSEDEKHTGRHWWGIKQSEGIAPLTGSQAVALAEAIGLPRFRRAETGTVLAVLAPRFVAPYEQPDHDTARVLSESLTTWFWPRMLPRPDGGSWIDFKVFYEGRELPVPRPEEIEPFRTMAKAMLNSGDQTIPGLQTSDVTSEKPKALLGRLTLAPLLSEAKPAGWKSLAIDGHVLSDLLDRPGGFQSRCHHIALMRSTWQVIKYLPCRPVRATGHGFAGVFLVDADEEIETAFAQSEPPAHDDWVPDSLEYDWHRRYVRIALRRIREVGDQVSSTVDAHAISGRGPDLSRLSQLLGKFLPAARVGRAPSSGGGGGVTKVAQNERNGIKLIDQGSLGLIDGLRVLTVSFAITGKVPRRGLTITATPRVLVVGGATEVDGDETLDRPTTIGWRRPDGRILRQEQLFLDEDGPVDWQTIISVPEETQVGVSLQLAEGNTK